MNNRQEMKKSSGDVFKWFLVVFITVSAVIANKYFSGYSKALLTIGWIIWLVVVGLIASWTALGVRGVNYIKDSHKELLKVVWPSRQETVQMTMTIMVVVSIVSLLLWAVDSGLLWAVAKITQLDR